MYVHACRAVSTGEYPRLRWTRYYTCAHTRKRTRTDSSFLPRERVHMRADDDVVPAVGKAVGAGVGEGVGGGVGEGVVGEGVGEGVVGA